jgi:ketopantoate reductase
MWWWIGLWVALVLGAGAVLGLLGLRLWRKGTALIAEMGTASENLTAILDQLNDLADESAGSPGRYPVGAPSASESPRRGDRRPRPH